MSTAIAGILITVVILIIGFFGYNLFFKRKSSDGAAELKAHEEATKEVEKEAAKVSETIDEAKKINDKVQADNKITNTEKREDDLQASGVIKKRTPRKKPVTTDSQTIKS